ncbi:peptidase G2 autoproteolytic cleavage domain-containing protein [Cohnella abietis]|uniref:Uncharacterized protein n=1 Tax=Cohnella abietis TaxID=2507935 RepID=A0A3T1D6V6_9BACL|nr:peptidase G2 autoproteolytic cleavage domain-containing protein [Cohnella abietis]BBI33803.1 hypothetical protein KCTCHS21_32020 [Cohnella abietis]
MANGCNQNPSGQCSTAEGINTTASGIAAHAEGSSTTSSGNASHSEGFQTLAIADTAHAEGNSTIASGSAAHTEGFQTQATADTAHAEGYSTIASGVGAHTEGHFSAASGVAAHAEGSMTNAMGSYSHAEGISTIASGNVGSHAEGQVTTASGTASHSEGFQTTASGPSAHAEGANTIAGGPFSHAEGVSTMASGPYAHSEGANTIASGQASHAEGLFTQSTNFGSHSEGSSTSALGFAAHAEGTETIASGGFSHAEGQDTDTHFFQASHIMGRFGDADESNSWFIGNGTSTIARGLGAKWSGSTFDMFVDGAYLSPAADYAELFEIESGIPIDVGYFVTVSDEDRIRKATSYDTFIVGVTSATPSIIGNSAGLRWQGKYLTDEWGRKQYQEVVFPAQISKDGNILTAERKELQPKLNPSWDPNEEYVSRLKRPEWVAVGLIGQIRVRDDATCTVHGYCRPNDAGVATQADHGYFVLKRTGPNQILILLN